MVRRVLILAALALCLLAPATASAQTRYAELSVTMPGSRGVHTSAVRRAPFAFDLLGARWQARPGAGVEARARAFGGRWSAWTNLQADGSGPVSHAEPVWVEGSDVLQLRVRGAVRRVRVALVAADRSPLRHVRTPEAVPGEPPIIPRAAWGADESIRRAAPYYAPAVRMVFVHHTATPNGYAPSDVPAIIRSIYTYHVRSNGWNDIGYNFLVDAFGRIYEGRAGGIDRPVVGAHTLGFNTGSVGIAVIGNGALAPLTPAARDALTSLIAWRLDVAHVDPLGRATMTSYGNPRFPAGTTTTFRVVSGHRDAVPTDCPGALIYPELDAIAAAAQTTGSPKIVDATATPDGLGADSSGQLIPIAFRARVLGGAGWTVTVLDAHGAPVASNSGSGGTVSWNWPGTRSDGTPVVAGTKLAYRIEAQDSTGVAARPLLGSLGAQPEVVEAPPLALTPGVISPDGDGVDDKLAIGYTLAGPSTVSLDVLAADGSSVDALVPDAQVPAGGQSARWGAEGPAGLVADGTYTVRLRVTDALGRVAERTGTVTVVRAVRKLKLSRVAAGRNASVTALWQQTQPAELSAELSTPRATTPVPPLPTATAPGPQSVTLPAGWLATLPDGTYTFALHARTAVGEQVLRESFKLDRHPPVAHLVRVRIRGRKVFLVVRLSDAGTVRVLAGARVVVPRRPRTAGLNGFRFRLPPGVPARLRLDLRDAAGNTARAGPYRTSSPRAS